MSVEWFPEDMTSEEKKEMLWNIPLEMRSKAFYLEMIYGNSYIVLNKDKTYDLYYSNYEGELIKSE